MAGSVYDTTQSPYTFREDDKAAADRQHQMDLATLNAVAKTGGSPAGPAPAPSGPGGAPPSPEQMGVKPAAGDIAGSMRTAMAGLQPSQGQAPQGIQDFISFGSNPMESALRAKAAQANMDQLNKPGAAFDVGAGAARENLDTTQRNSREALRDELTKTYGGNASQVNTALRDADQQAILDRRGLNSDLATGRAQAVNQTTAQAIQSALGFAGLGSQEKVAAAQLQQQKDLQSQQIASNEKLTYAGLDLEKTKFEAADANAKKGLDLQASAQALQAQGMSKDDAFRYASLAQAKDLAEKGFSLEEASQALQKAGMDQQNAQYYAGLAQQEKLQTQQLQTQVDVAKLQIGSAERLQANQQAADAAQADLERALKREMQGKEIETQTALQRSQQDFEAIMADKGYANAKDIETLKNEFAAELQRQGYTQQAALQAADAQARKLEADSQRQFEATQADLTRQFTTGERLDAESFTKSLQALEDQQQERMAKLTADLNLTAIDRQAGYTQALQAAQAASAAALQKNAQDAAAAAQAADQAFQQTMQANGFTQQQTLQAQAAQYEAAQADKQLSQQYTMFLATQAQQDKQFAASLGLDRDKLNSDNLRFVQEMDLQRQQLGIQKDQWETMKADQKFQDDLNLAMTGIQMWNGDDPAAIQPFVERLVQTMGEKLGMDPALQQAIQAYFGGADTGTATNIQGTATGVDKAKDAIDKALPKLPATVDVDKAKSILDSISKNTSQINIMDLRGLKSLVGMGIPVDTVANLMSLSVGSERFNHAYYLAYGKDWGG